MYSGTPIHCENYDLMDKEGGGYDASAWFGVKSPLKEKNALINLPYVIDNDIIVSQTNACLSYLGRKLSMVKYFISLI